MTGSVLDNQDFYSW